MGLNVPDCGERALLDMALGKEDSRLKLYKNDITPAEGDTYATYTEATIAGYSSKLLNKDDWNAASTTLGLTTKTFPMQTFTFTGTGVVVGYYVIRNSDNLLLWSERVFTSPGATFNNSDEYRINLLIGAE